MTQSRSSKLEAEKVFLGSYIDYPYEQAKKHEKKSIRRARRTKEKRQAEREINEALSSD